MARYNIVYSENIPEIETHFCMVNDCYGRDQTHGLSWEDVCKELAAWHHDKAGYWMDRKDQEFKAKI